MKTHDFILGPVDTDSISICKQDMSPFSEQEQEDLINEINSMMPELIKYAHDGYFKTVVILKAKNYILVTNDNKIKLKGSSLKDSKKEPILKEMMNEVIKLIVTDKSNEIIDVYHKYIKAAHNVTDIKQWCAKKTITKSVMDCASNDEARLNERKVYDAVKDIPGLQEGDKVYIYPCIISKEIVTTTLKNGKVKEKVIKTVGLKTYESFNNDHDSEKLMERVISTMDIFGNILDTELFIDYSLSKNKILLDNLLNS